MAVKREKVYIEIEPKTMRRLRKMKELWKGVVTVLKIMWKFIAIGAMAFGIVGACKDLMDGKI